MKVRCSYCDSIVDSNADYCPNCGCKMEKYVEKDCQEQELYKTVKNDFDNKIAAGRKRKATIWGLVCAIATLSLVIFISTYDFLEFSEIDLFIILINLIIFTLGVTLSTVYATGFVKTVEINGQSITYECVTKSCVYLNGYLISKNRYPTTTYVKLSSDITIAVIPQISCQYRYGSRVKDVQFIRVYK